MPAIPRMPWETDDPRPTATEVFFWIAVLAAGGGFLALTRWRDTLHHGDLWDWFDWLEAIVSSLAGGFTVVGLLWVVAVAVADRRRD